MDDFLALERAAHDGAFGRENHVLPTAKQCKADDYRKGFVCLHGLDIAIENPRGSIREGKSADGTPWANRMAAHYGEFVGTVGADGDGVDVFIGPYPESKRVWVVNQTFNGKFDEHKVMLGFPDAESARAAYVNSYTRDWTGFGSMVAMSLSDFKQWLGTNPQTPAVEKPVEKILWSGDAPRALTFDAVLYQIRRLDTDGLIFDAVTEGELLQDADEVFTLDAMTSPYQQLPKRARLLMNMMNRVGDLQATDFTITKPYRVRGIINIAVIYALADGQTLTVHFHVGGSNFRVEPDDELISWKWMLNKLDVTITVAPEQGVELDLRTVARRLMQLAIKNSPTFAKQNAKKAETLANIEALKGQIVAAEMELAEVQGQIAAREAQQRAAAELEATKLAANKLVPAEAAQLSAIGITDDDLAAVSPYATYAEFAADPANQVQAVAITRQRALAVRNALRGHGWVGEMWAPLTRARNNSLYGVMVNPLADMTNFSLTLNVLNEMGEGIVGSVANDMTLSAEDLATRIDGMLEPEIVAAGEATPAETPEAVVEAPPVEAVDPAGEFVIPGDGSGIAVSSDGPITPDTAEVVAAAVAAEQTIAAEVPQAEMAALEVSAPITAAIPEQAAEEKPSSVESLLTYDLNFLQSLIDGTLDVWANGVAERIESIMQAHVGNDELQAKAARAIDVYTQVVVEAGRASLDAIKQVPDPLHDMPPAGQRANELHVESDAQKEAAALALRQQNGSDCPTPPTSTPVPERSSLDTALVEPGNPTGVLSPPAEPVTPEQAVGESGGVPIPDADVSSHLAEQPAAPDMPSIDKPVEAPVLDTAAEVAQIEPTEANAAPAGLLQIQENGQSAPILGAAKAEVGAELLAATPNAPIPVPDVEPAPEIKPVPEAAPQPEPPAVVEADPLPVQGDPSTPLEAAPAGVPEAVTNVPPEGAPTTTQVPDPLHDTPQRPEQGSVDMPLDPAQAAAEQPNEVVRREADQAYLDSVIDGSKRGESGRIGALFEAYEKDEPMLDKWREAVAVFTARIKS
ncbi:defense against restriction DarA-related protein [Paraburkholderia dipogonis]|uniref:defense against restriction DarA-related protein n=1 Tax=Paraburkholderia dipogonis TaxID=1211383 RepID=UPI0038B947B9